jgi:hypothetical protein
MFLFPLSKTTHLSLGVKHDLGAHVAARRYMGLDRMQERSMVDWRQVGRAAIL